MGWNHQLDMFMLYYIFIFHTESSVVRPPPLPVLHVCVFSWLSFVYFILEGVAWYSSIMHPAFQDHLSLSFIMIYLIFRSDRSCIMPYKIWSFVIAYRSYHTVDGSEIPHHLESINLVNKWDNLPKDLPTGAGFCPSTVPRLAGSHFVARNMTTSIVPGNWERCYKS